MFKDELGIEAKRGHQDKAIVDEPDVIAGPFDVECKRVERIRLWDALSQMVEMARPGKVPVLIFRRNRSGRYWAFREEDVLPIVREAMEGLE